MEINSYSTWLEIDMNAIKQNVAQVKAMTHGEVMAVIKANGYGHGARPVAQAMVAGGADWCGLARIEEALQLRRAGISCRMLVLGYTPPAKIPEAIEQNIAVALIDPELTRAYLEYARMQFLHAAGYDYKGLLAAGFFTVIARLDISYRAPAYADDALAIETESVDTRRIGGTFRQTIRRGETVIAEADVHWCVVDGEGRPARPPAEFDLRRLVP